MNDYRESDFYWAVQHIVDTSLKLAETRNALINAFVVSCTASRTLCIV